MAHGFKFRVVFGVQDHSVCVCETLVEAAGRPISHRVDQFTAELESRGVSPQQRQQLDARITAILEKAGVESIREVSQNAVQSAIGRILEECDLSVQTGNHYLRAIKQFSRWLVADRRIATDPIAHLRTRSVEADRKYVRRALLPAEATMLIQGADDGPPVEWWMHDPAGRSHKVRFQLTGPGRAMLYRVALGTGFRVAELRSLTPRSFRLEDDPPTVTVEAGYSKRRRTDVQPMRRGLAERLSGWLAGRRSGDSVFLMPDKPARMLQADLQAGCVSPTDDRGQVADFHSLRHTYIVVPEKLLTPRRDH